MEERQWKLPVGSVREWSGNQKVIKTHDNIPGLDDIVSPWMTYPSVPTIFTDKFTDCDRIAKEIFNYKEPIEGELWLDKVFENFITNTRKTFTGKQFKAYSIFKKGTYGYNFFSELSKRFLGDKIALNAKIAETINDINEDKIREKRSLGESAEGIVLSKEEIKGIKDEIRRDFKYDESEKLVLGDVVEIHNKLKEILNYLEQGDNFSGEQDEVFQKGKAFISFLEKGRYKSISLVKEEFREIQKQFNNTFKENWGARESYKKKSIEKLNEYISKYRKNIEDEELEKFNEKVGDLYAPSKEFYQKLKNSDLFQPLDVTDSKFIGEFISNPFSTNSQLTDYILTSVDLITERDGINGKVKYFNIIVEDAITGYNESVDNIEEKELQELIRSKQTGVSSLDIPMKLRFYKLYNKELDGDWQDNDLTLLETFEKLTSFLPEGHLLKNNFVNKIKKSSYLSQSDNSYAHFSAGEREIFFSSNCLKEQDFGITDLHSGQEIASVLTHEVGHAISVKLGRRRSMLYRKFTRECGWSWEQFQHVDHKQNITLSNNFIATGTEEDIKRQGTKSEVPLITEYAKKSPEEAFAEYYSFYTQYKPRIDSFLKGDVKALEHVESFNLRETDKFYKDFLKENLRKVISTEEEQEIYNRRRKISKVLEDNQRNLKDHIRTEIVDPFPERELETSREEKVNKNLIITQKTKESNYSNNFSNPNPVFTIFDYHTGKHDIIHTDEIKDEEVHYANKYLRRLSPTFSISKECYNLLQKEGYSINEIRDFTLSEVQSKKIPKVKEQKENVVSTYKGLRYRGEVISSLKLQKMSGIFSFMKEIWESDDLKKSLEELLGEEVEDNKIEDMKEILKSTEYKTFSSFFSSFRDIIKRALENKKEEEKQKYGDVIVLNNKGQVLLLQRSYQDTFMPGKWWIPGGKIEEGESFLEGAERELLEETGLDLRGSFEELRIENKEDCTIGYFLTTLLPTQQTILDNEEHYRLQFVSIEDLDNYDILLDQKDQLLSLLLPYLDTRVLEEENHNPFTKLEKSFNNSEITLEEYYREREKLRVEEAYLTICKGFDVGEVSLKDFQDTTITYQKFINSTN